MASAPCGKTAGRDVGLEVHPNPVGGARELHIGYLADGAAAVLTDATGREVGTFYGSGTGLDVRLDDVAAGVYSLRVGAQAVRVVVQ